jgi:hypothetical protein
MDQIIATVGFMLAAGVLVMFVVRHRQRRSGN